MMISRMLDVLTGKIRSPAFMEVGGPEVKADIVEKLKLAEKFDFGELLFERVKDSNGIMRYDVPILTPEEDQFMDEGLVPLPAPVVWYEFALRSAIQDQNTLHQSGLLVTEGFNVTRLDFDRHQGSGVMDGIWIRKEHSGTSPRKSSSFIVSGDTNFLNKIYPGGFDVNSSLSHGANWSLARYFTLMIGSRSTHTQYVDGAKPTPSIGLIKEKREPRYSHTIVNIVPREFIIASRKEGEAARLPPRLHWRRSHLRHLKGGKVVVIARMLVGRAELGAVSHEYRVPTITKEK